MLIITTLAASCLAGLYISLAMKVIRFRREFKVSMGDGGEDSLQKAIRAHANLAEYAPIGIILLACLELNDAPIMLVAIPALTFVAGRVLHPKGILTDQTQEFKSRVVGMQLTLYSILALIAINILWLVWTLFTH